MPPRIYTGAPVSHRTHIRVAIELAT